MKEDIVRMAREAGMQLAWIATVPDTNKMKVLCDFDQVQRFAVLVSAAEREECAKVCEEVESRAEELWDKFAYPEDQGMASGARQCTTAIRARGER